MENLKFCTLQTTINDGNMNTAARFYPNYMTSMERAKDFLNRRIILGRKNGFDGRLMFMADQKNKDGSYKIVDQDLIDQNPNGWADIDEDILIVTPETPGVVIGHPVADCPVVILHDVVKNVIAISHCSAEMTNMKLPKYTVEALRSAFDSKAGDIFCYISACAGPNWDYDCYPKWATDATVWDDYIVSVGNKYFINIKEAIDKQLRQEGVMDVMASPYDTITNPNFYSNCAASKGIQYKNGRHFAGAYFKQLKK